MSNIEVKKLAYSFVLFVCCCCGIFYGMLAPVKTSVDLRQCDE